MQGIEEAGNKRELENKRQKKEEGILSDLVQELKHKFGPRLEKMEVQDIRIGLAYTGVLLSDNYGGVASTPLYGFSGCPTLGFSDILKGKTADKILEMALSENPLEISIGIATVNALSHILLDLEPGNFPTSNVDVLDFIGPEDSVAMVGYFGPLVPKIMKITSKLTILEKRDIESAKTRTLPSEKASGILPKSDIIILTASTLVNRTFDELLSLRGDAKEVILLGPSSPLYPKPFFEKGITAVMGTRIIDPWKMLTVISEVGGTKKIHKYCGKKIAFRKESEKSA